MTKNKRRFHAARKTGGKKRLGGTLVAACVCIGLGRFCAEMSIGILPPVVLAVVALLLMLRAAFIFTIEMHGESQDPMVAIVQCIPTIVVIILLLTQVVLGYATKTTFLIQQNGCQIGSHLSYPAFMRILVGGTVLCAVYTVLEKIALRRRQLCVVLKACALGGSICTAFMLTYMRLITQWWLLFPELVVFIVLAALLLIWKRTQIVPAESESHRGDRE